MKVCVLGNAVHCEEAERIGVDKMSVDDLKKFNKNKKVIKKWFGVETKNVVKGNLVIGTRACYSCLVSDLTPSSYWIVNGDNYIEHNIAAGSTHCA